MAWLHVSGLVTAIVVTIALIHLALAREAASPCDPKLKQPMDDPHGYRVRGDRCEGTYARAVAGSGILQVVGFIAAFVAYDPKSRQDLSTEWTPAGEAPVHLRASSLRHRLYYRMDTIRPAGSSSYLWPADMLSAFALKREELGVVAWTMLPVAGVPRQVYLPLAIAPRGQRVQMGAEAPAEYRLSLVPTVQLSQVYVTIAPVTTTGELGGFVRKEKPLDYGYYPADREVLIDITGLPASGLYYVEISATLTRSGSSTTRLWFYHAPRPGR